MIGIATIVSVGYRRRVYLPISQVRRQPVAFWGFTGPFTSPFSPWDTPAPGGLGIGGEELEPPIEPRANAACDGYGQFVRTYISKEVRRRRDQAPACARTGPGVSTVAMGHFLLFHHGWWVPVYPRSFTVMIAPGIVESARAFTWMHRLSHIMGLLDKNITIERAA